MQGFTFKVIKRDAKQDNLYNIFSSSIVDAENIQKYPFLVLDGEECRLDLVSYRLYGTTYYLEELMVINNIINPFSINVGDTLYYVEYELLGLYNSVDKDESSVTNNNTNNKMKGKRVDPTRNTGVPPTVRPLDFKQVIVDDNTSTLKLNTRLS